MEERKRVLVVGGSGYLGQHILQRLARVEKTTYELAFTHHRPTPPQPLLDAVAPALTFRVDLRTGHGLHSISAAFGQPHVIVNCAALSVPRACEIDPEAAMATNIPSSLVNWLTSFKDGNCLFIHLSTDQVYEGVKSFYKEEDETVPVNMYGKSKVEAEKLIFAKCSHFTILRSSIIYGPQTIAPVEKSLPIQWIDTVLSSGKEVEFFQDEFRCPVFVKDVVDIVLALMKKWISDGKQMRLLLNVGGPDRLSRVQIAESVAEFRGYNHSLIKSVSAKSVNRGVVSPADISMDIGKLIQNLNNTPVSFKDGYYIQPMSRYVFCSLKDICSTGEIVKCRGRRRATDMTILKNEAFLPMPPKKLKSQEDARSDRLISDEMHIEKQALEDPQRRENITKQAAQGEQLVVKKPTDDSPYLLLTLSFEEYWDALASQNPTCDIPALDDSWSVEDYFQEQLVSSWSLTPNCLSSLPLVAQITTTNPMTMQVLPFHWELCSLFRLCTHAFLALHMHVVLSASSQLVRNHPLP